MGFLLEGPVQREAVARERVETRLGEWGRLSDDAPGLLAVIECVAGRIAQWK